VEILAHNNTNWEGGGGVTWNYIAGSALGRGQHD